jgi:hypothetical protein
LPNQLEKDRLKKMLSHNELKQILDIEISHENSLKLIRDDHAKKVGSEKEILLKEIQKYQLMISEIKNSNLDSNTDSSEILVKQQAITSKSIEAVKPAIVSVITSKLAETSKV